MVKTRLEGPDAGRDISYRKAIIGVMLNKEESESPNKDTPLKICLKCLQKYIEKIIDSNNYGYCIF